MIARPRLSPPPHRAYAVPVVKDPAVARIAILVADASERLGRCVLGVWIFGSCAQGRATAASDVDLGVLCDPPLGLDRARVGDDVARAIDRDVDVIDLATAPAALAWEIVTSGELAIERDEAAVERFVRRARFAVDDDVGRNRMILLAQTAPRTTR